ncbi:MAG: SurA N-terminal domain-containing protein [Xanthomonadaceae bacterium]|jgi:peptidyl-prolyl cis-trans isomerase D|nr:SurA N-terminal domain-containing protein [Xanthomonadaceae bacterium]
MLQKLRERTSGWVATIVIGLLMIPFLFVIDQRYLGGMGANNVAQISAPPSWWKSAPSWWPVSMLWQHEEISIEDFNKQFNRLRQQQQQLLGEDYDPREFASEENKRRVLDQLIDARVMQMAASQAGIRIDDDSVYQYISAIPAFQREGRFDQFLYQQTLAYQGFTPLGFQTEIRNELLQASIANALAQSAFVSRKEMEDFLKMMRETRDVEFVRLPHPAPDTEAVGDDEIQQWYDSHSQDFMRPESISIEYVEANAADMLVPEPNEATLRTRYEAEKARFAEPEQRLASHILIKIDANADAAAQQAAEDKIKLLIEEARKPGADFAALAKANSEDLGSRDNGGNLGWVERGIMVPEFEEALFSMTDGEIAGPLKTNYGYHAIQLRETRPAKETPFEEVRSELAEEQLKIDREHAYNALLGHLTDAIIENPSSLTFASEKVGLPVRRLGPFSRTSATGIATDPAVLRVAFSDDAIHDGTASDPIEIGKNRDHNVVIRVVEHTPAQLEPLEQVRDRVVAAIRADRTEKAATAAAEAFLEELRNGRKLTDIATQNGMEVDRISGLPRGNMFPAPGANQAIFSVLAPEDENTPSFGKVRVTNSGDYLLFAVTKVIPGNIDEIPESERMAVQAQFAQFRGNTDAQDFVQTMRKRFRITIQEAQLQSQQ